jgi:hypothetical protein
MHYLLSGEGVQPPQEMNVPDVEAQYSEKFPSMEEPAAMSVGLNPRSKSKITPEDQKIEGVSPLSMSSVPRSLVRDKLAEMTREVNTANKIGASDLKNALSSHDSTRTRELLAQNLPQVAVDEYSWLMELRQLGYSPIQIADVLLEKSLYGPWIYGAFEAPTVLPFEENFHLSGCVHSRKSTGETGGSEKIDNSVLNSATANYVGSFKFPVREIIEHLCGLGGARPVATGLNKIELGSVVFIQENSAALISLPVLESNSYEVPEMWNRVLETLEFAAGVLQQVGGCCDSFTILSRDGSGVELQKVELVVLRRFRQMLTEFMAPHDGILSRWDQLWSSLCPLVGLKQILADYPGPFDRAFMIHVCSLAVQFLSLALLSYTQAHCGPIRPCFLDTPQKRVFLLGSAEADSHARIPCIVGSTVELTCMGEMIGQPVFAFQYFPRYDKALLREELSGKFDVIASPEDLLDTWGPGELVADVKDSQRLMAISMGGGSITASKKEDRTVLHWSREKLPSNSLTIWFDRRSKVKIGAMVVENPNCKANVQVQMRNSVALLEELGTSPSYWEVSERQIGLGVQGGQSVLGTFQFNQTWVKMPGRTKKSAMLVQQSVYTADLESPFGVQVSICTGIARRVRLRELLADVLPAYVTALVTKPSLWESLDEKFHIIDALRGSNLSDWLAQLDHDHQRTFESLVLATLLLLQGTGVDRKGQNFVIACTQPNLPLQCFKVPCTQESYWARMLADSEEIATFAYITTKCLETVDVKCRGPAAAWANSTGLLWTAVSCYQDRVSAGSSPVSSTQWALRHSEAYLLGKPDAPLFVRVDRPNNNEEPRLLVSLSTIPPEYLYRLHLKGKPRMLRERKALDQFAESVIVLVRQRGRT